MGNKLAKDQKINTHYEIKEKLGSGSFATVSRAVKKKTGKEYAVKVIKKSKLSAEELAVVHDEVAIMDKVEHKNIVCLYEMFETPKKIYMVMEYLTGGELFDSVVEKGNFSEKEAARLIKSVAEAIDYLHSQGIVHRDLKPENLIYADMSANSDIKITDFGLAKIRSEHGHTPGMTTSCGTPGYVAPEVLDNQPYGSAVDLWSLGVILYILLCGFPPFYDENTQQLYKQIRKGDYDFPDPYWSDISKSAKDLVSKLLTVDPNKRYTAKQVIAHPWVSGKDTSNKKFAAAHHERLRLMQAKRTLRRTVRAIIAINKFAKVLSNYMVKIEATPKGKQ